jgi:hypothetical protein
MQTFTASNALEQALLDAQTGKIPPSKLFESLYAAQVFVLIDKEIGVGGMWSNDISMLVLNSQSGTPMIAMFTSPERAMGWPERAPAFKFGLLTDFSWLLKGLATEAGVVINPGSAIGVELTASIVQQLRESAGSDAKRKVQ